MKFKVAQFETRFGVSIVPYREDASGKVECYYGVSLESIQYIPGEAIQHTMILEPDEAQQLAQALADAGYHALPTCRKCQAKP